MQHRVVIVQVVSTDLLQQLRMAPLVVNPVEKDFMLILKAQPRVMHAAMVGTNLQMQQACMDSILVNPVEKDFMLILKVQAHVVIALLVGTNL